MSEYDAQIFSSMGTILFLIVKYIPQSGIRPEKCNISVRNTVNANLAHNFLSPARSGRENPTHDFKASRFLVGKHLILKPPAFWWGNT